VSQPFDRLDDGKVTPSRRRTLAMPICAENPYRLRRKALYPRLAGVANELNERMGMDRRFLDDHAAFPIRLSADPSGFNVINKLRR
jgi:hypothetical protein